MGSKRISGSARPTRPQRVVVYSKSSPSRPDAIVRRFEEQGVKVLDETPSMILVEGDRRAIGKIVKESDGWATEALKFTPRPGPGPRVKRRLK